MSIQRHTVLIRFALFAGGLNYLLSGVALVLAPQWFFENVAAFPPYNRHFLGDVGVFLLPLGAGLLWAARDPARHLGLIGVAVAGSWLHVVNHLFDDLAEGALAPQFFSNTLPLLALAGLLSAAYFPLWRSTRR